MEYLLLIYKDESKDLSPNDPCYGEILQEYLALTEDARQKGVLLGANPLQSISTATTVRVRNQKTETTDGPFAETKEQLAGYYLLDCADLDEAISYAARIPAARTGSIEIRPIMHLPTS